MNTSKGINGRVRQRQRYPTYQHVANCWLGRTHFFLEGWGSAQVDISVPILRDAIVTVPPADEQAAIVRYLDQSMGRLELLTAQSGRDRKTH